MSFYGLTKFHLLNGYSRIQVQDQVWFPKLGLKNQVITSTVFDGLATLYTQPGYRANKIDLLEPKQARQDLHLRGGLGKPEYGDPDDAAETIVLEGSIKDVDGLPTAYLTITHDKEHNFNATGNARDGARILLSSAENTDLKLCQIDFNMGTGYGTYMFLDHNPTVEELESDDGVKPFSFNNFETSPANDFFIDKQGHISQGKLIQYNLPFFEVNRNNYDHDYMVMHMACGPESESELVDEQGKYLANQLNYLNTTRTKSEDNEGHTIYTAEIGNIVDLYNIVIPLYKTIVLKETLPWIPSLTDNPITGDYDWKQDLLDKYNDLEEKMNGKLIKISGKSNISLYNFNVHDTVVPQESDAQPIRILDSLEFIKNTELSQYLTYPYKNASEENSLFLSLIHNLRSIQLTLHDITLKFNNKGNNISINEYPIYKKLDYINDFYQIIYYLGHYDLRYKAFNLDPQQKLHYFLQHPDEENPHIHYDNLLTFFHALLLAKNERILKAMYPSTEWNRVRGEG